jgi:hypothetical protein
MLIDVDGQVHRLFFTHDEVDRTTRYRGIARIKLDKMSDSHLGAIPRTTCRLDKVTGEDAEGKRIWSEVATGEVFLNHRDSFSKREGCDEAFRSLMVELQPKTTKAQREKIAAQFLASRPKRKNVKELKREVAELKARIAQLEQSNQSMLAEHNPA